MHILPKIKKCEPIQSARTIDPKATEPLRALLDNTRANTRVQALITSLKAGKLGLVLSGGGGKGAYQAGAILALHDCGITHFSSIAGTSVGGLNAALCHELCRLNDRGLVLGLWGKIAYRSVFALSFGFVAKLALYALYSAHLLQSPINFVSGISVADVDAELDSFRDMLERLLLSLLSVVLVIAVAGSIVYFLFFVTLPFLTAALGQTMPVASAVPLTFLIVVMFILPRLANIVGRRFALFNNAPLRRTIETLDIEAICDGKPPVICTLAERMTFPFHRPLQAAINFRPFYVPLNRVQPQQAVDVLLQTAAIPEVFRTRYVFGRRFVDGGMADNTPIFGAFQERPDTLLVVYLDHRFGRIEDLALWERLRLGAVIRSLGGAEDDEMMHWLRSIRMIAIIPSESLGGLLFGTLNFGTAKAQRLIALGYGDTLRRLVEVANASVL